MKYIKGGMNQGANPQIFENAKFLRYRKTTTQELILWNKLKNKQILNQRFRRQHPIGNYILDFFCPGCKLSIEIDGDSHLLQTQLEYDQVRTEYLDSIGIKELRFTNEQVNNNLDDVVERILFSFKEILNFPIPPDPEIETISGNLNT